MAEAVTKKKPFTSAFIYLDRVRNGGLLRCNILYWELEYDKVDYEGECTSQDPSSNWSLTFTKRTKSSTVFLQTKEDKTVIQGFVAYQHGDYDRIHSEPVPVENAGYRKYKIEFPSKIIHSKRNKILKNKGCLVLGFMFDARRLRSTEIGLHVKKRDVKKSTNFLNAYKKSLYTDFTIHAKGKNFHIHKAMLAARSDYFRRNKPQEEEEITLAAAPETVEHVIQFLYCGELPLLTLEELLQVFKVSCKLSITGLVDQFKLYFLDVRNEDNARSIRKVAKSTGVKRLGQEDLTVESGLDIETSSRRHIGYLPFQT